MTSWPFYATMVPQVELCYIGMISVHYSDVIMSAMASQNHRLFDCLPNRLVRRRSQKTSKLRVTGLCEWYPPVTGGFSSQRATNAENVKIWWRQYGTKLCYTVEMLKIQYKLISQSLKWTMSMLEIKIIHFCWIEYIRFMLIIYIQT